MLGMEILVIIGLILLLLVLWIISVQRKFAVMDGNIVGLVIATDKYQLVTIADKNGERHWVPLSAGRITTKGDFPEEMHVSLSPQRLAATVASEPQVIFLPDGEISRFTLTLQSYDKQHHFRVVSQGTAPVSVENDG